MGRHDQLRPSTRNNTDSRTKSSQNSLEQSKENVELVLKVVKKKEPSSEDEREAADVDEDEEDEYIPLVSSRHTGRHRHRGGRGHCHRSESGSPTATATTTTSRITTRRLTRNSNSMDLLDNEGAVDKSSKTIVLNSSKVSEEQVFIYFKSIIFN
jgi:hypothetical protein